jgi:hypothetical protein
VTKTSFDHHVAAAEARRWITALGIPMIVAAAFTAAALAGLGAWLIAPAIVVGPGLGGIALIWLALSTDTNGTHVAVSAEEAPAAKLAA